MKRIKQKFYDRYCSIDSYETIYYEDEEGFFYMITIPQKDNFKQHLENIRRLLKIEYGGVFDIVFWDEEERIIETNIPYRIYRGFFDFDYDLDFFSIEEKEKVERFLRYKNTGETVIQSLW